MHAPAREEIIDDERQDKGVGAVEQVGCPAHAHLPQKPPNGSGQERDRCEQHQPLVCVRLLTLQDGHADQHREHDDIADRNGEELARIAAWRPAIAPQGLDRYRHTDDEHDRSEECSRNAQRAMDVGAASGHQGGLRNQ